MLRGVSTAKDDEVVVRSLALVEGFLTKNAFLCGSHPTLADIAAYEELGQNQACFANVLDYSGMPHIQRWLSAMAALPMHDVAHRIFSLIGDARKLSGGMRTIARANKVAAAEIEAAVKLFSEESTGIRTSRTSKL